MKKLVIKNAIKTGASGEIVETLQSILNSVKARPKLKVDGKFGPNTKAAVKHFQKLHLGGGTGVVDKATAEALNNVVKLPTAGRLDMQAPDWTRRRNRSIKTYEQELNIVHLTLTECEHQYADGSKDVTKFLRVLKQVFQNLRRNLKEWSNMSRDVGKAQGKFDELSTRGKLIQAKALLKGIEKDSNTLLAQEKEIERLIKKAPLLKKAIQKSAANDKKAA